MTIITWQFSSHSQILQVEYGRKVSVVNTSQTIISQISENGNAAIIHSNFIFHIQVQFSVEFMLDHDLLMAKLWSGSLLNVFIGKEKPEKIQTADERLNLEKENKRQAKQIFPQIR